MSDDWKNKPIDAKRGPPVKKSDVLKSFLEGNAYFIGQDEDGELTYVKMPKKLLEASWKYVTTHGEPAKQEALDEVMAAVREMDKEDDNGGEK